MNFSNDYDPGKAAYLRNPNFEAAPTSQITRVDPRVCPGCLFPYSQRPTPHVEDCRCAVWKAAHPEHEHGTECKRELVTSNEVPRSRPQKVGFMREGPSPTEAAKMERDIMNGRFLD